MIEQEIRRLGDEGLSMRAIAKQVGVSSFKVWEVLNPDKAAERRAKNIASRRSPTPRANVVRRAP